MKNTTKTKIKNFWEKHWYKIVAVTGLITFGIYEYGKYRNSQSPIDAFLSEEEADDAIATVANNLGEPIVDSTEAIKKYDDWYESRKNDPARQLTNGGWITDDYEIGDFDMADLSQNEKIYHLQEFIVNDAPLVNAGSLGEDLIAKIKERNPDLDEFELGSVVIDIYSRSSKEPEKERKEE